MDVLTRHLGFPYPDLTRVLYDGYRLLPDETLEEQSVCDGDSLDFMMQQGAYRDGLRFETPIDIDTVSLEIVLARGASAEHALIPGRGFLEGEQRALEWSGSLKARRLVDHAFEWDDSMQERQTGGTGGALTWNIRFVSSLAER